MIELVLPPTHEQLEHARGVVSQYVDPTPTVTILVRGRKVFVKLESLQVTGSFKIRGALAAIDAAHREDPTGAVITASLTTAGNCIAFYKAAADLAAEEAASGDLGGGAGDQAAALLERKRAAHA